MYWAVHVLPMYVTPSIITSGRSSSQQCRTMMTSITSEKEWLEKRLENEDIRFYPYDGLIDKDCIGYGGFGVVFKAKVATSGITVAYKMIKYSDEGEFFKCFVNEVCNLAYGMMLEFT